MHTLYICILRAATRYEYRPISYHLYLTKPFHPLNLDTAVPGSAACRPYCLSVESDSRKYLLSPRAGVELDV